MNACPHAGQRHMGWTLEADPSSPYVGLWVDPDPACRRPSRATLARVVAESLEDLI